MLQISMILFLLRCFSIMFFKVHLSNLSTAYGFTLFDHLIILFLPIIKINFLNIIFKNHLNNYEESLLYNTETIVLFVQFFYLLKCTNIDKKILFLILLVSFEICITQCIFFKCKCLFI